MISKTWTIREQSHEYWTKMRGEWLIKFCIQTCWLSVLIKERWSKCNKGRLAGLLASIHSVESTECGMNNNKEHLLDDVKLVAWHSGRTLVFDRRTFPVPRSSYSWRVITYLGKTSAIGQPTRPTQPFIFSGSINWVVSNFVGCVLVVPPGECWWG